MEQQEATGEIKTDSDGKQNKEGSYDSVFDEHDGVDDDAGADHGVGDIGDNFEGAICSFFDDE